LDNTNFQIQCHGTSAKEPKMEHGYNIKCTKFAKKTKQNCMTHGRRITVGAGRTLALTEVG